MNKLRITGLLLAAALVFDLIQSILMWAECNNWFSGDWTKRYSDVKFEFGSIFGMVFNYNEDAVDMIIGSCVRFVTIPVLMHLAIRTSDVDQASKEKKEKGKSSRAVQPGEMQEPLLETNGDVTPKDDGSGHILLSDRTPRGGDRSTPRGGEPVVKSSTVLAALIQEEKDILNPLREESRRLELLQKAKVRRFFIFAVLFCAQIGVAVYSGVKALSFEFTNERLQGFFLAAAVFMANIQFYLAKIYVETATAESGHYMPELHNHPVHYMGNSAAYSCDICTMRIRKEKTYRCKLCDFDVCHICFERAYKKMKQAKKEDENAVRGEKGKKNEEVSSTQYIVRGVALMSDQCGLVTVAALCLLINQAMTIAVPNIQGTIINSVIERDSDHFLLYVKLYVGLNFMSGLFGGVQNLCINFVGRKVSFNVRNKLFSSIVMQDIAFYDGMKTGQLTSRLMNDVYVMVQPLRTFMNTLLSNSFTLLGGTAMAFYTSWRLTLLAITSVGPIIYVTSLYAKWSKKINMEIWQTFGDAMATATEAFTNIRTIRSFSTESAEIDKYKEATGSALKKGVKDAWASSATYAITNYVELCTSVLILWYGGSVALNHPDRLTVGELITFQLYWGMINNSYQQLNGILNSFTEAAGAASRVLSLLDSLPDIDPNAGIRLEKVTGHIRIEDVKFHYQMRPENSVLNGVTLDIPAGHRVALVGKSGEGKSTLIHLLMRFYDVTGGRILFDGIDVKDLNLKDLHNQIGIVTQDTQLFGCSVEENIAYGCPFPCTLDDIVNAAKLANAHEFIMGFEEHYKTMVGERGVRVSGGQKQRIALARCLLRRPRIILLDEATSALDTESEAQVQEAIDKMIKQTQCTVVLVAHRLSTVINSDKICVLSKGRIIEQGNHDELVHQQGGVYARLVQRQTERDSNIIDEDVIGAAVAKGAGGGGPSDLIDSLLDD